MWQTVLRLTAEKQPRETETLVTCRLMTESITSPGVVSLSRIRKEPCVFPGARRSLMASFLEMFLKNHLQHKHTTCFTLRANHFPFPQGHGMHFMRWCYCWVTLTLRAASLCFLCDVRFSLHRGHCNKVVWDVSPLACGEGLCQIPLWIVPGWQKRRQ